MYNSVRDRVRAARLMCKLEDMYKRGCEDVTKTEDGTYIYGDNLIEVKMVKREED